MLLWHSRLEKRFEDDPPRETIADKNRVYPGDGVAPLGEILRTLFANGFEG